MGYWSLLNWLWVHQKEDCFTESSKSIHDFESTEFSFMVAQKIREIHGMPETWLAIAVLKMADITKGRILGLQEKELGQDDSRKESRGVKPVVHKGVDCFYQWHSKSYGFP